uniref:DNA-directed RNA polymerase subunit alpha n=1 Tax=Capsosiphon fulvescens TaxID=205396 RepID=A0A3P8MUL4_9CHLO|nr:alpha subunit of RNA polymerase [Capsosiphon fulvescens]AWX64069.1 alpha subunit of RNA polymerase [Capsosiphon fulvescens]AYV89986.1 alpha subunit of RNA polymerase [Capsosiphon fulvescens]
MGEESVLLSCIDSKVSSPIKFYGRFELGPFAPSNGLTVANALRRSLLSQLTGTAITNVEITGAVHEYETLIGIRESILDILLNLKQVILASDFELFTPQIGFLNVKGPGIVRARDLQLPNFIYYVDPDQYIATLAVNGHLNLKFVVACGKNHITHHPGDHESHLNHNEKDFSNLLIRKGHNNQFSDSSSPHAIKATQKSYPNVETNHFYQHWKEERVGKIPPSTSEFNGLKSTEKNVCLSNQLLDKDVNNQIYGSSRSPKIGYFTIDAIFMPVTRVNYLIESQVKKNITNERIILEVWTNGSIHPRQAIHLAAKSLVQLFLPFQQMKTSMFQFSRSDLSKVPPESKSKSKSNAHINDQLKQDELEKKYNDVESISNQRQIKQKVKIDSRILDLDIGNLDLTSRPYGSLKQANINTLNDLLSYSRKQLLQLPNLGQRSLKQIEKTLHLMNLHLQSDSP